MRFAIRDDDACYFTRAGELDRAWSRILPYAPVSFAVTPKAVEAFHLGDPVRFRQGNTPRGVAENQELVSWLAGRIRDGTGSILCHGYTHAYLRVSAAKLVQEYVWKPYERLAGESRMARQYLEQTFGRPVTVFVPPGNGISRAGIEAAGGSFPRILATFPLRRLGDFRLEMEYVLNYLRRLYYQARHGTPNPFGEWVGGVRLLPSFSLTSLSHWEGVRGQFEVCRRLGADFTLACHYWEMDSRLGGILDRLLELACRHGCLFRPCEELFTDEEKEIRHGDDRRLPDAEPGESVPDGQDEPLPARYSAGLPGESPAGTCQYR